MRYCIFLFLIFISVKCPLNAFLFSGNASKALALQLSSELDIPLGRCKVKRFNDGEVQIEVLENVENKHVFILQSTCQTEKGSTNDHFMELFLLARALKRGHVEKITAIIPYYGYSRQDRGENVPISASEIATLLEAAGIDRVVTIDIHAKQTQGFFHKASLDNLDSAPLFANYLSKKRLNEPVVVAPDAGAIPRAVSLQQQLKNKGIDAEMVVIVKRRKKPGVVESVTLLGDIENKDAIIIDDICDTGGTLCAAGAELKKMGAKSVVACITHPVFSDPAIDRIESSAFEEVVVTNSIPLKRQSDKVKQISIIPLLTDKFIGSKALQLAQLESNSRTSSVL